jgi:hypothetical protein
MMIASVAHAGPVNRLRVDAEKAYQKKDYTTCAALYLRVAGGLTVAPENDSYNAACCQALAGEVEPALSTLESAVKLGYHDADGMTKDVDLNALHASPAW